MGCVTHYKVAMDTEWTVVKHKRQKDVSKHITPEKAFEYQRQLDIRNLANVLLSIECQNIMADSWQFFRVVKGNESDDIAKKGWEICWLPVHNDFRDRAFFRRKIE
jgi:hypothetical protein